ncbi:hypothetical protein CC1G_05741 [Coprinopsis cinerea okayama7|uniref:Uncharacterized protein n=1 Tax=Coprinopsis cinerea (strain Okayama-7 / 130 / ATCC MYA-4618 / FGSC 9003) TaxID=240176 RepID=A8NA14_COPC7|nr:hypothetical protein CC1G_05741 [Coprinopsis cinerea okayama7\|eukprot:XP_001831670.1 hypothetical protein CC1G_05741 [Coprinopsis cinerea okayama7\
MDWDSSEEYVETSDPEEREEMRLNPITFGRSPGSEDDYRRPHKRMKVHHDDFQLVDMKDLPTVVGETPVLSQSSDNFKEHGTSPTRLSGSPVLSPAKAKVEDGMDIDEPDQSQDPLLLQSPLRHETLPITPQKNSQLANEDTIRHRGSTTPLESPPRTAQRGFTLTADLFSPGIFRIDRDPLPVTPQKNSQLVTHAIDFHRGSTTPVESPPINIRRGFALTVDLLSPGIVRFDNDTPESPRENSGNINDLFSDDDEVQVSEEPRRTESPAISPRGPSPSIRDSPSPSAPSAPPSPVRQPSPDVAQASSPTAGPSSLPQASASPVTVADDIPEEVRQMQEEESGRRYALRRRAPAQINPYRYDEYQYKLVTKNAPEARVKIRSPGRGTRRDPDDRYEEEEEESQDVAGETMVIDQHDEDGTYEERERSRERRRKRTASPGGVAGDVLDLVKQLQLNYGEELEDTQEEKEMARLARENKRMLKQKKREERERKRKEREEKRRANNEKARSKKSPAAPNLRDNPKGPSPFPELDHDREDHNENNSAPQDDDPATPNEFHFEPFTPVIDDPQPEAGPSSSRNVVTISSSESEDDAQRPQRRLRRTRSSRSRSIVSIESSSSSSSSSEDEAPGALPKGKAEILYRMYPRKLADMMLANAKKEEAAKKDAERRARRKQRQSSAVASDGENGGVLKPGQTKVRRAVGGLMREIKGDTESEDEPLPEVPDLLSDHSLAPPPPRTSSVHYSSPNPSPPLDHFWSDNQPDEGDDGGVPAPKAPKQEREVYDISDSDSDEEIDKEAIATFYTGKDRPRLEKALINYMLNHRPRIVDRAKRKASSKSRANGTATGGMERISSSRDGRQQSFKWDIVAGGAKKFGRGKQQDLHAFYSTKPRRSSHSSKRSNGPRSSHLPPSPTFSDDEADNEGPAPLTGMDLRKKSLQQKRKERKAKAARNGLYMTISKQGGVKYVSRKGPDYQTLDLQQEDRRRVARNANPGAKIRPWEGPPAHRMPRPTPPSPAPRRMSVDPPSSDVEMVDGPAFPEAEVREDDDLVEELVLKDGGVHALQVGVELPGAQYIKNGWLQEVINSFGNDYQLPSLGRLILPGYEEFDLSNGFDDMRLREVVQRLSDVLLEFADKLPDPDQDREAEQLTFVARHVCLAISHHSPGSTAPNEVAESVAKPIEEHLLKHLSQLKDEPRPAQSIDIPLLQFDWYAVEVGLRLRRPVLDSRGELMKGSTLAQAIQLTMHHLLTLGLDPVMEAVKELQDADTAADVSATHLFAAEIWVRLIHVLEAFSRLRPPTNRKQPPLFWHFVLTDFRTSIDGNPDDPALIERCWRTLFSLCALSQFSTTGMVVQKRHLPACWDIVELLFGRTLSRDSDSEYQDAYLRYLLSRCLLLQERWKWQIVDIAPLVKQVLDKVFVPRKFAGLGNEKAKFPTFLRNDSGDKIAEFEPKDSSYTLLLKFIIKASQDINTNNSRKITAGIRKLISLSDPVSAIAFVDEKNPTESELATVVNRITAAVVTVYLDPTTFSQKVSQLQRTIPVDKMTDHNTRMIVIQGIFCWARFLLRWQPELGLEPLAMWGGEVAKALAELWPTGRPCQDPTVPAACSLLFETVRRIFDLQAEIKQYPEAQFLSNLKPLTTGTREQNELVQDTIIAVVNARFIAIPPERPPLPAPAQVHVEEESESQDQYGDMFADIDWSNVEIPEALAGPVSAPTPKEDDTLKKALGAPLTWLMYRSMKASVEQEESLDRLDILKTCYERALCWVGCMLIQGNGEAGEKEWTDIFSAIDKFQKPDLVERGREREARKFDTLISLACLERYPKCVTVGPVKSRLFHTMVNTLVTPANPKPSLDAQFLASFLSLEQLQHPLLSGCDSLPPAPATGRYTFDAEQFLQFRLPLINYMFKKLESMDQSTPDFANHTSLVKSMLSAMRSNCLKLGGQRRAEYVKFCHEVTAIVKQCDGLSQRPDFEFWVTWDPAQVQPHD